MGRTPSTEPPEDAQRLGKGMNREWRVFLPTQVKRAAKVGGRPVLQEDLHKVGASPEVLSWGWHLPWGTPPRSQGTVVSCRGCAHTPGWGSRGHLCLPSCPPPFLQLVWP